MERTPDLRAAPGSTGYQRRWWALAVLCLSLVVLAMDNTAWGLAVAGQTLLVVGGQLAGVILLPPHRQFRDVGHHGAAPLPAVVGASNAPVVHCSPPMISGRA